MIRLQNNVLFGHFGAQEMELETFSAEVYSWDMKKYQFETRAFSITEAYSILTGQAVEFGVIIIKCIAIYRGLINDREKHHPPCKVWHLPES